MSARRLTSANLDYWQAKMPQFAICMAWDAFRLALGSGTENFHPDDVRLWLKIQNPPRPMTRRNHAAALARTEE